MISSNADAIVSTNAVVDRLLRCLDPHRHEVVLFDVNRCEAKLRQVTADKVLERLKDFKGKVLKTNLSIDSEQQLRQVLEG